MTDNEGDAVANAVVDAFRIAGQGGTRRAIHMAAEKTDDQGYYRLATLPAGSYALSVSARPWHLNELIRQDVSGVLQLAYPVTFYPAAEDPGAAELLVLKAGDEARADVVLRLSPVAHLTVLFDPSVRGKAESSRSLVLSTRGPFDMELPHYTVAVDAEMEKIEINDIAPGHYDLNLLGPQSFLARQKVDVAGRELEVTLGSTPLAKLSGRLDVRGDRSSLGSQPVATIQPISGTRPMGWPVATDGTFHFDGVEAGRYRAGLYALGSYALTSVSIQGRASASGIFDVPQTGSMELRLVVDTTIADVTGKVYRAASPVSGVAVLLIPRDHPEDLNGYRRDQSDSDGSFLWKGVPAGEYLTLALDEDLDLDLLDPADVRPFLNRAKPVTISGRPGQVVRLELDR